jgi:uncharacterized protein Yka (UPF0111/DUF47 family)
MNININLVVKLENDDGVTNLLKYILKRTEDMNQDINQLQTDLNEINAKVTLQGEVLGKVAMESTDTLAKVIDLEGQIDVLEQELASQDLTLPQELKDTVARIKTSLEANQIMLASVDAMVPDEVIPVEPPIE